MAFTAGLILDVRGGTGADTNGGGFATTVTNMAVDLAVTGANTSAPVVTSASYAFIARDDGHWLYIPAGTNFIPGWYPIASTAGGAATLNAAAGAGYLSVGGVPYAVTTAVGCAATASPTGGTWSVDYSQGTPIAFTDLVIDAATNTDMTSAANPLGVNFVGNIFNVTSGAGFSVQRVQIISIPSAAVARVDKSLGTLASTDGNATAGGPLATPGLAGGLKIAGNTVFVKAATYTISNTSNVAGGRVTDATTGTASIANFWIGWNTIRHINNMDSSLPTCNATANGVVIFTLSGQAILARNIKLGRNASETTVTGMAISGTHVWIERCTATSIATGYNSTGTDVVEFNCFADTCATGFVNTNTFSATAYIACVSKAHTANGFSSADVNGKHVFCIAYGGTGSANGFTTSVNGGVYVNCTAWGNAGDGWHLTGGGMLHVLISCAASGNAETQFEQSTATEPTHRYINCGAKADGAGTHTFNAISNVGFITLTADPFTNAAGNDFSLNTTAGGGALLRGAGFPGAFPGISTTGYIDIGAVQHQDAAVVSARAVVIQNIGTY